MKVQIVWATRFKNIRQRPAQDTVARTITICGHELYSM